jgi:hypothetical protein
MLVWSAAPGRYGRQQAEGEEVQAVEVVVLPAMTDREDYHQDGDVWPRCTAVEAVPATQMPLLSSS